MVSVWLFVCPFKHASVLTVDKREGNCTTHPSSHQLLIPRSTWKRVCSLLALHPSPPGEFPLASSLGEPSADPRGVVGSESWGTWVHESCVWVSECVHLLFLQMSSDYRYSFRIHVLFFFFFLCVCETAHLCLRTRIGRTAIETLTLFLERVWPVSVLSTASVKYACLYRIYFSFGLGVIHQKVNPSLFSWGVITLPFVSSRTCEWKVSRFWLWKKKNYSILMCTCTERCMKC